MKKIKIQSLRSLEAEMRAVARGEKRAPADAARQSFNSVEALLRLLTPENRILLAIIRDQHPESIAALAKITGRKPPNLTRTLSKLETAGFVVMKSVDNKRVPMARVKKLKIEIDPYSQSDRLELA